MALKTPSCLDCWTLQLIDPFSLKTPNSTPLYGVHVPAQHILLFGMCAASTESYCICQKTAYFIICSWMQELLYCFRLLYIYVPYSREQKHVLLFRKSEIWFLKSWLLTCLNIFFRNNFVLFLKIESWNFQNLIDLGFRESSQISAQLEKFIFLSPYYYLSSNSVSGVLLIETCFWLWLYGSQTVQYT